MLDHRLRLWAKPLLAVAAAAAATLAASGAEAAALSARTAPTTAAADVVCGRGAVRATLGGRHVCLRKGQRCKKRYERAYRRHGFHCQAGRLRRLPRRHASPPAPPPPPAPAPLTGTGGLHSTAGVAVPGAPLGLSTGFGSVWVRTGSGRTISRIDGATGKVTAEIEDLPTAPSGFVQEVAVGLGAVWTSNINAGSVSRIDPATNKVVATIPVWPTNVCGLAPSTDCSAPVGIAFTPGAVWVALHHEWKVVRIDPATNAVVATVTVGSGLPESGPSTLAATNGFVYVGGAGGLGSERFLKRIDPATNAITPVLDLPNGCGHEAAAGGHVWIGTEACGPGTSGSIADVDTSSNSIVGQVGLGGPLVDAAIDSSAVWAITGAGELLRVDPTAHVVTGRLTIPGGMGRVAAGDEGVWLAVQNAVYRIGQ